MTFHSSLSAASTEFNSTPCGHAHRLLSSLGLEALALASVDDRSAASLWAESGAMWLSGHRETPPRVCPAPLASCAQGAWLALCALRADKLDPDFAAFRLLGERAAIAGLQRQGRRSAGGACQLVDTQDGTIALNLAREDDYDLLPAWLEAPVADQEEMQALLRQRATNVLIERARLLGLAAAEMAPPGVSQRWYQVTRHARPRAESVMASTRTPLVVDLSALWAGPLCGQLLSQCGARVIKVESESRPDGARSGPADFYHLLNSGKQSVALDLRTAQGRQQLLALLLNADIVIESSRPRALEQMGIRAADVICRRPGAVWLSITGYGRSEPMRDWVAYGDDAGVAAGLSWLLGGHCGDPVFCADAIADPLTGLHGALLALALWQHGGGVLADISLRDVVGYCIGSASPASSRDDLECVALPPQARSASTTAAELGADTASVLREFV